MHIGPNSQVNQQYRTETARTNNCKTIRLHFIDKENLDNGKKV